ncbi:PilW family protein [Endozoicomonas sp. SM1973]|uniref:PilW family protein n=1 Tax=Spartinivicinus marinus TaxID=2994442 RepID=A0A853I4T6_9GAMM|nr:type II secretion system protein [Spartinivicinus marinus]MCX4026773.1 PilW family protein [Spartinivicinus marinus]NYZ64607.1 PilW family protein [Spartinivicinus marinus]
MNKNQGYFLIELMIAMLLGIIVVMGVVEILSTNRVSVSLHENISRIQDNARFALNQISNDLRMAGYMNPAKSGPASPFVKPKDCNYNKVVSKSSVCTTDGTGSTLTENNDLIAIKYDPINNLDCGGNEIAATDLGEHNAIINQYYIKEKKLVCNTYLEDAAKWTSNIEYTLAENVTSLQILYKKEEGMNTNTKKSKYINANYLNKNNIKEITAVKVALTMEGAGGEENQQDIQYKVLDIELKIHKTNKNIHRTFQTEIALQNSIEW